jgi:sugar phosphate isomerase/epimerase
MSNIMPAPVGVQLFSLREELKDDFSGVIRTLAETGYVGVEPCLGLPEALDEATKARITREHGLEVSSLHVPPPLGENEGKVLAAAETYGAKRLILAYYDEACFTSVDGIKQACEFINQCNQVAVKNGLEFGYHNHNAELQMVAGRSAYLHMLDYLDPTVFFELDTYWAKVGGQDPVEVIRNLGARTPLLHIKDGPADNRQSRQVALGEGVMDIPAVVEAGRAHTDWLIVEIDGCDTDMMTAIQKSYRYLVSTGLARGNR